MWKAIFTNSKLTDMNMDAIPMIFQEFFVGVSPTQVSSKCVLCIYPQETCG